MPAYTVKVDESEYAAVGARDGVRGAIIFADNADDAEGYMRSLYGADADVVWTNATVTEIEAGADLIGWKLRCAVVDPDGDEVYDVTVTGAGADNTVDEIAALMVTALEAAGGADLTPSYNAGTNTLTVAAIGDDIGDHTLVVECWPPVGTHGRKVSIPGFVGTIVDEGIAGAVLTVVLAADAYTVPAVTDKFAPRF